MRGALSAFDLYCGVWYFYYMPKKYLVAIVILLATLPACCPMVSVNPLSTPDGIDERLFGAWKPESKEGEQVYLHIGRKSDKIMVALSVEHRGNGMLDEAKMPFFLTRTGKNNYWNVRFEDLDDGLLKGYAGFFFLKYSFADDNTLLVYQLDRRPIISAVKAGELQGQITYKVRQAPSGTPPKSLSAEKRVDCVTITDTSSNLLNYLESGDSRALFPEAMRFIRFRPGTR